MDKFTALFAIALGVIYSDLDASNAFNSLLFPLLSVCGIAYLFWFQGFVVITTGLIAASYSDLV